MTEYVESHPAPVQNETDAGSSVSAVAPPPGMEQFVADELQQEQFGGPGQQAIAGLEGVARGATLGGSDVLERAVGVPAVNLRGRREANPITSGAGTMAGGAGLIALTGGIAAPAEAGAAGVLLAAGAEGAAFGAGTAVSDAALGEPNLNAQKVLAQIGMGAALGVGVGALGHGIKSVLGKTGAIKGSVAEAVEKEASAANRSAETTNAIAENTGIRKDAPEIAAIVERNPELPREIQPGMVSEAHGVQQGTEALLSGAPSYSAIRTQNAYQAAHDGAVRVLDSVVPEEAISKNQLGAVLQDSLAGQIETEAQPFNELYDAIREDTPTIPLKERSAPSIARNILDIPEVKRSFNSPAAKLARDVAEEIQGGVISSVEDLRAYQTELRGRLGPTAPPAEKRILGIVQDKLDDWERRAIREHAEGFITSIEERTDMTPAEKSEILGDKLERLRTLQGRIDEADAQYAPFRKKISDLASWLGKERVGGAKDATAFVRDRLEPEDLINKLTQKKYAGLGKFMEENFPEQAAVIREYQKNQLRIAASKSGEFNPKMFFRKVNELEPEIRNQIFFPDEIKKISDMEKYMERIPSRFKPSTNTSNTSGMDAFRKFFESPVSAITGNARDFGIEQYIKRMGSLPDHIRPNMFEIGAEAAQKFNQLNAARVLAEKTDKTIADGIRAIVTGSTLAGGASVISDHDYNQKVDRIKELAQNPDTLSAQISGHVDGVSKHLPQVSQGITNSIAQSAAFLNSKVPRPSIDLPLSPDWKPSIAQKQKFDRYYMAVQNPIGSLKQIKHGTLTLETMEALKATHPELLHHMQQQLKFNLNPAASRKLSPAVKRSLSMFLEMPLDNGQLQSVMAANQATFMMPTQRPSEQGIMQGKTTQGGLGKLNIASRVAARPRESSREDT